MRLRRHRDPGKMLAALKRHLYPRVPETPESARALVLRDHRRGDSLAVIARRYGIDPATVSLIIEAAQ